MSRGYSLICSVCKSEYSTKFQWSQHLTERRHQSLARKACLKEWDELEMKECCLVVFSSFLLKDSEGCRGIDSIVNYLSANVDTFVTDVVWWEDRPYVAFVQFESSQKLHEVVTSLEMSVEALIDGQRVQMKPAVDLLDLEWFGLLPRDSDARVSNYSSPTVTFPRPSHDVNKQESSEFRGEDAIEVEKETEDAEGETSEGKYLCGLKVKGIACNTEAKVGGSSTKRKVANFCLRRLEALTASTNRESVKSVDNCGGAGEKRSLENSSDHCPDENEMRKRKRTEDTERSELLEAEHDDDVTVNVKEPYLVSTLMELTQQQHWLPPKYIFYTPTGSGIKPTFSCSVTVNEVEYTWSDAVCTWKFPLPRKKQEAQVIIAAYCLTQIMAAPVDSKQGANRLLSALSSHLSTSAGDMGKLEDGDVAQKIMVSSSSLVFHFWSLCHSMTIPDVDYQNALKIVREVQATFCREDPTARAIMFKYWHLKLRNTPGTEDPILIYTYLARALPATPLSGYSFIPIGSVTNGLSQARKKFSMVNCSEIDVPSIFFENDHRWPVKCNRSGMIFWVLPFIHHMAEVQVCRLAEYMSTFDIRCHALLALAKYWTSVNKVQVGVVAHKAGTVRCYSLLEPYTLEWLVLFFLCYQKIIPTPRQIQQRKHEIFNERHAEVDIGFAADPEFAREWISASHKPSFEKSSEEFALSVLSLFQKFLQFCGELHEGHWILNTRDGELIDIDAFLTSSPPKDGPSTWTTQMSPEELATFRSMEATFSFADNKGEKISSYKTNLSAWKVYMIHPFIFSRKFTISTDIRSVLPMMGQGGAQVKKYLKMRKSSGEEAATTQFGTLEKVMLLEK